jgi:hypothetical protein
VRKAFWFLALIAVLALATALSAYAQALNPTPNRESKLLFSFEDDKLDGWISDPNNTGSNELASLNTDPQFVSDGKGSLKLNLTDIGGWKEPVLAVDLAEPLDLKDWGAISMDVYVPAESLYPDQPGGWFQLDPRMATANGTAYYGNRDCHAGWNHWTWNLAAGKNEGITRIFFAANTDGARPWTGPIYIDNIRAWKSLVGLHPDEKLVLGFDKADDASIFTPDSSTVVKFNSDKQYIIQGDGSVMVDFTGATGWSNAFCRGTLPQGVDLTKATAIMFDVFVPADSGATDWWQVGAEITGDNLYIQIPGMTTNAGEWDTVNYALSPAEAANMTNVTGFNLIRNSGAEWRGPIYIDNLRVVIPTPVVTVVKGDLSGDGKLAINDVTLALQIAVGLRTATADQLKAGDLDGNGKIDIAEVTRILKAAVGLGTL